MSNEEMKKILLQQPIGVAMYVSGMLQSYHDGIVSEKYMHCSSLTKEVNHGVVLVGFGSTEGEKSFGKCKDYWIIRNSWGAHWGQRGFFKLCADFPFTPQTPVGTCHVNEFGTWPTMDEGEWTDYFGDE